MATYSEKLLSPLWQKKRLQVLNKAKFKCQSCGYDKDTLHVHHLSYEKGKEPWQYPLSNFKSLCFYCHKIVEDLKEYEISPYKIVRIQSKNKLYIMYYAYSTDNRDGEKCLCIYSLWIENKEFTHRLTLSQEYISVINNSF